MTFALRAIHNVYIEAHKVLSPVSFVEQLNISCTRKATISVIHVPDAPPAITL